MQRWELEEMVPVGTATYKESTGESTINFIFATPLLSKNLVRCKIAEDFDHSLDHQPILSEWTLQMIDKSTDSRRLLAKIDRVLLIKTLQENLASILPLSSKTAKELDEKVISLVEAINITINTFIPKAKLCARSILGFGEDCKDAQMGTRRLKKIWKKKGTEDSWEAFRLARAKKSRVITKVKKKAYCESRAEACNSPKELWNAVKKAKN